MNSGSATHSSARRLGYRIFGPAMPYLLHLRPAEWPVMASHTTLGWLLAVGIAWPTGFAWLGLALWVVALNGGTLALNSAFDRDEGDIAYLRSPPPPPAGLAGAAMALLLAGLLLTLLLPLTFTLLYLIAMLLSIAYSVPPMRFKRLGGVDWLINMIGFGALTPWAGWAISGRPLDLPHAIVIWSFCPLFAALYPLTQLYQMDEDRIRGDQTLVLRVGPKRSLDLAILSAGVAFGMLVVAGAMAAWGPDAPLRFGLLALAATAWLLVLLPWRRAAAGATAALHQRGMYRALAAWAFTDVAVLLAWRL